MSQLEFELKGFSEADSVANRRVRRAAITRTGLIGISAFVLAAAVYSGSKSKSTHAATIHGIQVRASRVLVMVDNSGSMDFFDSTKNKVAAQLAQLRAAGIDVSNQASVFGFAISETPPFSMLKVLPEQLAADPSVDSVYFISDFWGEDASANTAESTQRFVTMVRNAHVRLYLATVNQTPSSFYYGLARESGGDVIP